jgi:type II secretory pathway component GspD/PulD (secretin)
VLGWAFKNHNTNDDRQELLVFITPRTVRTRTENVASLPSAQALWQNRTNP